ncbi:hypothetical protein [Mycobacterium sp.]|jgi:hypothetical protein|uniref:hypothetical protein n=1 Tax=Mycobacterium sp. TaxID=1785 RepID=UPI00333F5417|nr:hypothetical protein [Mycobacterium sp.]
MSSQIRPLEDLTTFHIAYWLPPGGRDNGVWADMWVVIADVDAGDVTDVLDRLARSDVGGYAAIPGGRRAGAKGPPCWSVWVDLVQYGRAENVLMLFMRGRLAHDPDPVPNR